VHQPRHPTARAAILAALLPQKTLILARAQECIGLTPREAVGILGWDGLRTNQLTSSIRM